MSKEKTALVIGATGLVGGELVKLLIKNLDYSKIIIISRRKTSFESKKIEEIIIDFKNIESIKDQIKGDILFSCLGTTLKQAGSKAAQYEVDYTYQYEAAKIASLNCVKEYCLVSSAGANSKSIFFYPRIKGKLENEVKELNFDYCNILRPSVLMGKREKRRSAEESGARVINSISRILPFLNKYRGIQGHEVALALINSCKTKNKAKYNTYTLDEIFDLIK